ncbi:hypothetical protein E2C01_070511 [Portunus trituberculatus]|uniref:Secreted protein n=1 Tax=Portunus trituberculatus TaxID=210409 RepID=A0A5B7I2A6_PORTR|nr:hypothetical protein [Portunus trituberculatus]
MLLFLLLFFLLLDTGCRACVLVCDAVRGKCQGVEASRCVPTECVRSPCRPRRSWTPSLPPCLPVAPHLPSCANILAILPPLPRQHLFYLRY